MIISREGKVSLDSSQLSRAKRWHLITSEYPPQPGGVSDYTRQVAHALAECGDEVDVWCPIDHQTQTGVSGIRVHGELGQVRLKNLRRVGAALDCFSTPRKLLLQWVPHGYGWRSMNVPFCVWLWTRSVFRGDEIDIMIHEPFLMFGERGWKQDLAAAVHRVMTLILLRSARRIWVSTPAWAVLLKPYALGKQLSFGWLPVPGNIPVVDDPAGVAAVRSRFNPGMTLFGHFGTYGRVITDQLRQMIPKLLDSMPNAAVLLIGPGSERFRNDLIAAHPSTASRVMDTGFLSVSDVSHHIAACDVMMQPFPDGVTTRRTSVMAALAHSRAVITTSGRLTEPLWAESQAVAIHEVGDLTAFTKLAQQLCEDPAQRSLLGRKANALYTERFDISCVVNTLRGSEGEARLRSCVS